MSIPLLFILLTAEVLMEGSVKDGTYPSSTLLCIRMTDKTVRLLH